MANLSVQILAGVPDCIHGHEGYVYPKPSVQLAEGVSSYTVSPSVTTYTQGNSVKYSSIEESAYSSVSPLPILKQAVYSSPVITKSYVPAAPVIAKTYVPSPHIITKSYLPPVGPSIAPVITKSYLPPVSQVAYTAPLSKVATYTPTNNIVPIPVVKSFDYSYPKIATGYQAASVS